MCVREKGTEVENAYTSTLLWGSIYNDAHSSLCSFVHRSIHVRVCGMCVSYSIIISFAWACVKFFRHSKGSTNSIWAHRLRWQAWHGLFSSSFHLVRADDVPHFKLDLSNCTRALFHMQCIEMGDFQTKEWRPKKTKTNSFSLLFGKPNCKNKRNEPSRTQTKTSESMRLHFLLHVNESGPYWLRNSD